MDRAQQRDAGRGRLTEPVVARAAEILRAHAIRYVVVGGQAIARSAATATRDVDIMVTTGDYRATVDALAADDALTFAFESGPVARFGIQSLHGMPLDVIDAGVFAGAKPPAEFFDFLLREESESADGITYASPAMVWYSRLMTKRWRAYAEKIVTNVIDGVEPEALKRVLLIAKRFGTDPTISARIAYVQEELRRPEVASLAPPERSLR